MTAGSPLFAIASAPEFLVLEADASAATDAASSWRSAGLTVRALRGQKMRSTGLLMDEVGAALQFPHYFGENWAALDECVSDLEWIDLPPGLVLLVRDAADVLVDEPREELEALVTAMRDASDTYAKPIEEGEWWDRPAIAFHVVLQADANSSHAVVERWSAAGAVTKSLVENEP